MNSSKINLKLSLIYKIVDITKFIKEYKNKTTKNKLINIYLECINQDFY